MSSILCLIFFLIVTTSTASAREIKVPAEHSSIQGAIDGAAPGDTILVYEGVYEENLLIEKPLSLISISGAERTTVRARDPKGPAIMVRLTEKVTVGGFTFESSNTAGLFLDRVLGAKVNGNVATGNYTGIRMDHSNGNMIIGNTTVGNLEGITLAYSNKNTVEENNASDNSEKGILLYYSNSNVITGNTTNDNFWNGITLWSSDKNLISDNVSVSNTYGIVINDSKDNILRDNRERRRIYYLLPVALVYIALMLYLLEKKLFFMYYSRKLKGKKT